MKRFKDDVFETLHHIADFKSLKKSTVRLYKTYVLGEGAKNSGKSEGESQKLARTHLESCVEHLRTQLGKDKTQ